MSSPTVYPINTNIPATNNNPSQDQPRMQTNNSNIANLIAIDHIAAGNVFNATHAQVTLSNQSGAGLPPWNSATSGAIYLNQVTYPSTSMSNELFFTTGTTGNQIQMSVTDPSLAFSTFGSNTIIQAGPPQIKGGWTFLPGAIGGLVMTYGFLTQGGSSSQFTINLPIAYKNKGYAVVITPQFDTSNTPLQSSVFNQQTNSFQVKFSGPPDYVNWITVGIPE